MGIFYEAAELFEQHAGVIRAALDARAREGAWDRVLGGAERPAEGTSDR